MKKILFTIAIVVMLVATANAQNRDGFFSNYDNGYGDRGIGTDDVNLLAPNHGYVGYAQGNGDAPLGSGLLIMTALGAGYVAVRKKRR